MLLIFHIRFLCLSLLKDSGYLVVDMNIIQGKRWKNMFPFCSGGCSEKVMRHVWSQNLVELHEEKRGSDYTCALHVIFNESIYAFTLQIQSHHSKILTRTNHICSSPKYMYATLDIILWKPNLPWVRQFDNWNTIKFKVINGYEYGLNQTFNYWFFLHLFYFINGIQIFFKNKL